MEKICYYLKVYSEEGEDFYTKDDNIIGIIA